MKDFFTREGGMFPTAQGVRMLYVIYTAVILLMYTCVSCS